MNQVQLKLNDAGRGKFYILEGQDQAAEMEVALADNILTVFHTEVAPAMEGKGLAKQLLEAMTNHARQHHLKVKPLCSYVHTQFKRHREAYADIWEKAGV